VIYLVYCVAHEMALIKVAAKSQTRSEILQIAQIYDARRRCQPDDIADRGYWAGEPHRRTAEHA